jgi:hypothetical protein
MTATLVVPIWLWLWHKLVEWKGELEDMLEGDHVLELAAIVSVGRQRIPSKKVGHV